MNIHPIRNDYDHRAALAEINRIWGAAEGSEDGDKLDILATLVERYEESRWLVEEPAWDPIDVLHYGINEMGHTRAELSELLGSRSRASEILNRQRALTVKMVHRISESWKIPAALLVKPYQLRIAR